MDIYGNNKYIIYIVNLKKRYISYTTYTNVGITMFFCVYLCVYLMYKTYTTYTHYTYTPPTTDFFRMVILRPFLHSCHLMACGK